jgi:hypothetical protein
MGLTKKKNSTNGFDSISLILVIQASFLSINYPFF